LAATPAAAADPPRNDDISNATPITVPYSEVLDTTGMTVGPSELAISYDCEHPAYGGGVWYTLVGTGDPVVLDISGSDYDTFVFVGVGLQDDGTFESIPVCDVRGAAFETEPGTQYYVMVADEDPEDGIGGSLHVSFFLQPTPPTGTLTIGRFGTVNRHTGVFRLHGTYSCTETDGPAGFILIDGVMIQRVHGTDVDYFWQVYPDSVCDGKVHRWSVGVSTLEFEIPVPVPRPGRALVNSYGTVCAQWSCSTILPGEQRVVLRPHRRG
jgi:hypothetical protein